MTQVQGLPEPPDVHSQNVDISAQDGGVAAYQIGQLNNHISVDGLATLQELLQLNEDLKTPDGDSASQIKRHLSQQKPDMGVRELIALELRRMRTLPEFALDDYNNYDPDYAHALSERVIEAARLPVAVVAVMAFWGDPDTDRWWRQTWNACRGSGDAAAVRGFRICHLSRRRCCSTPRASPRSAPRTTHA
jgi:hypothetical protein